MPRGRHAWACRRWGRKLMVCVLAAAAGSCFVAPSCSFPRAGSVEPLRDVSQEAATKRVRKAARIPKAKVKKLGKSRKGASESSVWDFIREKDKQALEEGAFMETFAGKAVESVVYFLCFLIILWEIYLNTLYPRAAPTYNPLAAPVMDEQQEAFPLDG
ncbi:unnamed protein product [Effrenium voratum]|nr:unnamed protein product [Effrenium voratum]